MTAQSDIAGKGYSNTPKLFKYVLNSIDYGELTLTSAPEGWDGGELTFIRDPEYKGVLTEFSTNDLKFVKDGRDYVQTAYEAKGIDYEITITIYSENSSTFLYEEYFVGKIDLSTYKIDSIGVSCEIINTGFQNRILNRDNIEVDLNNTKFIGGGENSMEQLTGMPATLSIPQYDAQANADWRLSSDITLTAGTRSHYSGMNLNSTEFNAAEASSQVIAEFVGSPIEYFFKANVDHTIDLVGNVNIIVQSFSVPADFTVNVRVYKNNLVLFTYQQSDTNVQGASFDFPINETDIDLVIGDELKLVIISTSTVTYNLSYSTSELSINEDLGDTLPSTTCDAFPVNEFIARILQLISGDANPLKSDLFERTDSVPNFALVDGDFSLMCFTVGRLIREFDISQVTFNGGLKKAFKTLNSILNIGLGFEVISDENKVRIEKESYFFDITENASYPTESEFYQTNEILDLSSYLNDEVIEKEVLPDWYHNEIKSGYNNFEYENIQGLKEFNTKSTYATPIKSVKSTFDLVSDYRFDTQGVNKLREKPQSTSATEDVTGDNHVFGFDVSRGGGTFDVKTDEDFDSVSGGVDPSQSYNLDFTPRRNLERHGNRIRSMQLAVGDEIQWMQSDKNTKLVTQKTGEDAKPENGDILVNDLDLGYWIPEAYTFEAPVSSATIAAIKANPYGVIKIDDDKYGWVLEIQSNNEDNKGQFKLLRVDLNNVKIV